ncbi:DUF3658 domain-containing protein [Cohnella sp.]|uniref:DUF3658 domain-containing protein n=1 Tax=Cohnella sp. TaxID=1883426 RepID=UPI003566D244
MIRFTRELGKKKYTTFVTSEVMPKQFQAIYKQIHKSPLTQHEREDLEREWLALSESREPLRIWRNGRIQSVSEIYYDDFIVNRAKKLHGKTKTKDFIQATRLIGETIERLDQQVGDEFVEYRLKKL